MKQLFFLVFSSLFCLATAQETQWAGIMVDYTYQSPIGILKDRFGNNSSIGVTYIQEKNNNFFYGIDIDYIFGNNIKEDSLFSGISTINGEIIDAEGYFANLLLYERGFSSHLFIGYAISLEETKKHSIYLSSGIGYLQHKIFIDKKKANIPQLSGDYENGYDRLTNGLSTKWGADYMYFNKKNNFQIVLGLELIYAFTKNQRTYLFDYMKYEDTALRNDILLGIRCGFVLPINRGNTEEFHYY